VYYSNEIEAASIENNRPYVFFEHIQKEGEINTEKGNKTISETIDYAVNKNYSIGNLILFLKKLDPKVTYNKEYVKRLLENFDVDTRGKELPL
jgi:hypothetical protein